MAYKVNSYVGSLKKGRRREKGGVGRFGGLGAVGLEGIGRFNASYCRGMARP